MLSEILAATEVTSGLKGIVENPRRFVGMSIKEKIIFITGGAGFIDSTLAGRLANDNQITLFDSLERNTIKHTSLDNHPNINLKQGNILDKNAVANAMQDADIVVHAAAIAGFDTVTI